LVLVDVLVVLVGQLAFWQTKNPAQLLRPAVATNKTGTKRRRRVGCDIG
jgi:hypothetical protein